MVQLCSTSSSTCFCCGRTGLPHGLRSSNSISTFAFAIAFSSNSRVNTISSSKRVMFAISRYSPVHLGINATHDRFDLPTCVVVLTQPTVLLALPLHQLAMLFLALPVC